MTKSGLWAWQKCARPCRSSSSSLLFVSVSPSFLPPNLRLVYALHTSEGDVDDGADDGHGPVELVVLFGVVDGPPQHEDGADGGHGDSGHPQGQPPEEQWRALQAEEERMDAFSELGWVLPQE